MNTAKETLLNLIENMPEDQIWKVIEFMRYLKMRNEREQQKASENIQKNIESVAASLAVENLYPSNEVLEYCKMRDLGKISCEDEIEILKKKYSDK